MGLADQAERLRRRTWPDDLKLAMDEIYLAFLTDVDTQTGPISVTLGDGSQALQLPASAGLGPLGDFTFPDLIFPDLLLPNLQPFLSDRPLTFPSNRAGQVQVERIQRQRTQADHQRATVPGVIVGGSGPTYGLTLFPNGRGGGGPMNGSVTATELNGKTDLLPGTWVLCFRHVESELTITQEIEREPGNEASEKVISTYTDVKIIRTDHEFVGGSKPSGSAFLGTVVSGSNASYVVRIFLFGRDQGAVNVEATQGQIASGEVIPAGTAVMVALEVDSLGGQSFWMQVPVWMRR